MGYPPILTISCFACIAGIIMFFCIHDVLYLLYVLIVNKYTYIHTITFILVDYTVEYGV